MMPSRREVGLGLAAGLLVGAAPEPFAARLAAIERRAGGRLGVWVIDTATGRGLGRRADERFPMCSTFKLLAAGAVLAKIDRGKDRLSREVAVKQSAIVPYSPVTQLHVGGTMTLAELCAAAITHSDNTAGNLLLESIGGPASLTATARGWGDRTTRLDRNEPTLNEAKPGDPRDTTSPAAMARTMQRLLTGDALSTGSRAQLATWLRANTTGDTRLRAGVPRDWVVGDKTGTGDRGTTNDIAILWPPHRAPIIAVVYLTECDAAIDARNKAIADVGRMIAAG